MIIGFVLPGPVDTPTGGYRYDRAIIKGLKALGHQVDVIELSGSYPFPSSAEIKADLAHLPSGSNWTHCVIDGLAGGANPALVAELAASCPVAALVHHPLCLESGLSAIEQKQLLNSETDALSHADCVITTSKSTTKSVEAIFHFDTESMHTIVPGVDHGPIATPSSGGTINLLCVGSIIARKGHRCLIEALAKLPELAWNIKCVGMTDYEPELFDELKGAVAEHGLSDRVQFTGAVDQNCLEEIYSQAHIFVLPSLYEGYGMVYAEAIVRGIPVIGTTAGAIPNTVPKDCGLLVEPDNPEQLADSLKTLISDTTLRETMRANCLSHADVFPSWSDSSYEFAQILERMK